MKRVLADAGSGAVNLPPYVDAVLEDCEARMACDKTPHFPVARASTVAAFSEKIPPDLFVLDDMTALRGMGAFPKNSLLVQVRSENTGNVWDAFCGSWIAAIGGPE